MRWIWLLPLGALMACARPSLAVDTTEEDPMSAAFEIRFDPPEATSVDEVTTAYFEGTARGVEGPRGVSLELLAPQGDVYAQQVDTLSGGRREIQPVAFSLPVAGTHISSSDLTGTWTATLAIGGRPVATRTFELTR